MVEAFKEIEVFRKEKNFKYKMYAWMKFVEICKKKKWKARHAYSLKEIASIKVEVANKRLFKLIYELYNYFFARYVSNDVVSSFKSEKGALNGYGY